MKAKEIYNYTIQIYKNVNEKHADRVLSLRQYIIEIATGERLSNLTNYVRSFEDDAQRRWAKAFYLPCALMSAQAGADKAEVVAYNNIIVIDVDVHEGENESMDAEEIKRQLITDEHIVAVAKSASGKGLYAIMAVSDIRKIKSYYPEIEKYFMERYNIVIDKACSNVNRLRFMCADPQVCVKREDREIVEWDKETVEEPKTTTHTIDAIRREQQAMYSSGASMIDNDRFATAVIELCDELGLLDLSEYTAWLKFGWSCTELSCGETLFDIISSHHANYEGSEDCSKKFRALVGTNRCGRQGIVYYCSLLKTALGKMWVKLVCQRAKL